MRLNCKPSTPDSPLRPEIRPQEGKTETGEEGGGRGGGRRGAHLGEGPWQQREQAEPSFSSSKARDRGRSPDFRSRGGAREGTPPPFHLLPQREALAGRPRQGGGQGTRKPPRPGKRASEGRSLLASGFFSSHPSF